MTFFNYHAYLSNYRLKQNILFCFCTASFICRLKNWPGSSGCDGTQRRYWHFHPQAGMSGCLHTIELDQTSSDWSVIKACRYMPPFSILRFIQSQKCEQCFYFWQKLGHWFVSSSTVTSCMSCLQTYIDTSKTWIMEKLLRLPMVKVIWGTLCVWLAMSVCDRSLQGTSFPFSLLCKSNSL